ncbi:hypothetical protein [Fischerella sp. PCC 9605]|uniref:hypothetical protein n=1 Tax=Fischerella sp. PCC 9605 TaxID=1173024 RepID=UPI00047C4C31|nr:hypothetical protein [Fischerella sp. PCC 9605]
MKIYAPNIHLFAFQLYKGSNIEVNNKDDGCKLWQGAEEIVRTILHKDLDLSQHIDIHKEPDHPRVDLLKESEVINGDYSLGFDGKIFLDTQQGLIVKGFAYPLRIYDSYGLWLNLRRPEEETADTPTEDVDVSFLSKLNPNNIFTLPKNQLFLGQTLLITAWLTSPKDKKHLYEIAQGCLQAVFPNPSQRPPFNRQGELFGSPIFEYGLFRQPGNYQHVLIWLFADEQTDEKLNLTYQELLDLFFFRTKVVKAFQDSRAIYQQLASAYQKIDNLQINNVSSSLTEEDLNKLTEKLKELPQISVEYTRWLRNLEEYQKTITINAENYNDRLQQIHGKIPQEDLNFLETFYQKSSPFFQKQINADLGYFNHGSALLEQAISSIRGIVEIEQAKRDRSLEQTIQIIGVGLGGGAIVSGVVTQHIDKPFAPISLNNPLHPIVTSLFWSVLATLFFGWLAWLWTKRK